MSNDAVGLWGLTYAPIVGDYVVHDGSYSGTVVNNKVTKVNMTVQYAGGARYNGLAETSQQAGVPAAGNGDGGGPVLTVDSTGHVYASGIISGIDSKNGYSASCSGIPISDGRTCSATVLFTPIFPYLQKTNSKLYTYSPLS